jgi:hypothetical protein
MSMLDLCVRPCEEHYYFNLLFLLQNKYPYITSLIMALSKPSESKFRRWDADIK